MSSTVSQAYRENALKIGMVWQAETTQHNAIERDQVVFMGYLNHLTLHSSIL